MAVPPELPTIAHVLDVFFGGPWGPASVGRLSSIELNELAETIDEYYDTKVLPEPAGELLRIYSGGATFMQPGNPAYPFLTSAVLYADEIVMSCPLDKWVYRRRGAFRAPGSYRAAASGMEITPLHNEALRSPGFWESSEERNRQEMGYAVALVSELDPAIRRGWLIPVPHLRYWRRHEESIWAQVRRDVKSDEFQGLLDREWELQPANSDNVRGMMIEPEEGIHPHDYRRAKAESPSLYFNGTLAVSGSSHARFLPAADSDFELLRYKIGMAQFLHSELRDALAIRSMDHVLAPVVDEDKVAKVADIRDSESSFADWRRGLRSVVSGAALPSNADLNEVQNLVNERLQDLVDGIRRDIARSRSISDRVSKARIEALDVGFAAAIWMLPVGTLSKIVGTLPPVVKFAVRAAQSPLSERASLLLKLDQAGVTRVRSTS